MSEQLLMQLGGGGLIVILILREVFNFLKSKRTGPSEHLLKDILRELKSQGAKMSEILIKTNTLYDWHDKEDNDGVKIWYVRSSLENAIEKLAENISKQTDILQQMFSEQKSTRNELRRLEDGIRDRIPS